MCAGVSLEVCTISAHSKGIGRLSCSMSKILFMIRHLLSVWAFLFLCSTSDPVGPHVHSEDLFSCRIVVVGAGVAGLTAAKVLSEKYCCKLTVLEALDRVGGRVYPANDKLGGVNFVHLNLGANYIHGIGETNLGPDNPEAENPLLSFFPDGSFIPSPVPPPVLSSPDALSLDSVFKLYRGNGEGNRKAGSEVSVEDAYHMYKHTLNLMVENTTSAVRGHYTLDNTRRLSFLEAFDNTLDAYAASIGLTEEQKRLVRWFISFAEDDLGGSLRHLHPNIWDVRETSFDGDDAQFSPNASFAFLEQLKGKDDRYCGGAVKKKIRLKTAVLKIVDEPGGDVRVVAKDLATNVEFGYNADMVVVTVPLGILRKGIIEFVPPLKGAIQEVVSSSGMGMLLKLFVRFTRVFWPVEVHVMGYQSTEANEPFKIVWNHYSQTSEPILCLTVTGDDVEFLANESEAVVLQRGLIALENMFPSVPVRDLFLGHRLKIWAPTTEPWIGGSWAHRRPETSAKILDDLAQGDNKRGRVVFAGEGLSVPFIGTLHGALVTGTNAGKEAMEKLLSNSGFYFSHSSNIKMVFTNATTTLDVLSVEFPNITSAAIDRACALAFHWLRDEIVEYEVDVLDISNPPFASFTSELCTHAYVRFLEDIGSPELPLMGLVIVDEGLDSGDLYDIYLKGLGRTVQNNSSPLYRLSLLNMSGNAFGPIALNSLVKTLNDMWTPTPTAETKEYMLAIDFSNNKYEYPFGFDDDDDDDDDDDEEEEEDDDDDGGEDAEEGKGSEVEETETDGDALLRKWMRHATEMAATFCQFNSFDALETLKFKKRSDDTMKRNIWEVHRKKLLLRRWEVWQKKNVKM